jgi:hypothetical protein
MDMMQLLQKQLKKNHRLHSQRRIAGMTDKIKNSFRPNNALLRCFTASLSALISGTGFCDSIKHLYLTQ